MRIIEQIVDYLLQQGALTTEDEQYLSDSGYIRPRSWLAPDEVRASAGASADGSAAIEGECPHQGLISQLERGPASRSRRRGGPLHRLASGGVTSAAAVRQRSDEDARRPTLGT